MSSKFILLSAFMVVASASHLGYFRYSPYRIYKPTPVFERLVDYPYDAPVEVTSIVHENIPSSIVHSASGAQNVPESFDVRHADQTFPSPLPAIVPFTRDSYGLSLMDNAYVPDSGYSIKNV